MLTKPPCLGLTQIPNPTPAVAEISITPGAEPLVHSLLDELGQCEGSPTPFLIVHWFAGGTENRRGPDGEAMWELIEPPEWRASVGGWKEPRALGIRKQALNIGGVRVLRDSYAEKEEGCLVVGATDGRLTVVHSVPTSGEPAE